MSVITIKIKNMLEREKYINKISRKVIDSLAKDGKIRRYKYDKKDCSTNTDIDNGEIVFVREVLAIDRCGNDRSIDVLNSEVAKCLDKKETTIDLIKDISFNVKNILNEHILKIDNDNIKEISNKEVSKSSDIGDIPF